MTIKEQLLEDMKSAMRAHESERLNVIRFLMAEIKNAEIDGGAGDDAALQKIIATQVKKTKDAMTDFQNAGRSDLVAAEEAKVAIMETYLPKQMADHELQDVIKKVIAEAGEELNHGQLIGKVMKKVAGFADGARVSAFIEELI